jgi:hypothetical protein
VSAGASNMHTALRATSITLQDYVRRGFVADPDLGAFFDPVLGGTMEVSLNDPEEMRTNSVDGVSLWLYRVERDDQRLNAPPTRPTATRLQPTPLPLRLHYLVTPIVTIDPAFPLVSPGREQEILGKAIQLLYERPVLRGTDLRDTLTGSDDKIAVRLEPMSLEEITRIWQALQRPYQLSVSYEATLAMIAPEAQPAVLTPVRVAEPRFGVIVEEAPA